MTEALKNRIHPDPAAIDGDMQQKVLIVDDKPENLLVLERLLSQTPAGSIRAASGNDALKATIHHDFSLAILDVQMPDMDGYELAEILRSEERTRNLPIIFLSAVYSDEYHVFKGYEAGAVDFVTKPYRPEIMLAKVRIFLELDRQKKELQNKIEIERQKNHLENILLSMTDSVMVVVGDGIIQTANNALATLLGYEKETLIGMPFQTLFEEGKADFLLQLIQSAVTNRSAENEAFYNVETRLINKEGDGIPVLISGSAFHDSGGMRLGSVFTARDITLYKLEEQNRIMMEKMTAMGMMAGGIAHELNNPMMGIHGFIEYCMKHTAEEDKRYEVLNDAKRETRRCMDLVRNLLTFSHMGRLDDESVSALGIDVISDRVLKLLSYRIEKDSVVITKNIPRECPEIQTKGNGIQQVLLNLMTNALDAIADCPKKEIRIDARPSGDGVVITVADSGNGIAPEHMQRIFDPFYTTKPVGKGTGLGLSVSKSIVESHGGKLRCGSEVGIGTKFIIELPGGNK